MMFASVLLVSLLMLVSPNFGAAQISLGACSEFAAMAGSTDTCSGAASSCLVNGYLGLSPGTSVTGNWKAGKQVGTAKSKACAKDGLSAWKKDRYFRELPSREF